MGGGGGGGGGGGLAFRRAKSAVWNVIFTGDIGPELLAAASEALEERRKGGRACVGVQAQGEVIELTWQKVVTQPAVGSFVRLAFEHVAIETGFRMRAAVKVLKRPAAAMPDEGSKKHRVGRDSADESAGVEMVEEAPAAEAGPDEESGARVDSARDSADRSVVVPDQTTCSRVELVEETPAAEEASCARVDSAVAPAELAATSALPTLLLKYLARLGDHASAQEQQDSWKRKGQISKRKGALDGHTYYCYTYSIATTFTTT